MHFLLRSSIDLAYIFLVFVLFYFKKEKILGVNACGKKKKYILAFNGTCESVAGGGRQKSPGCQILAECDVGSARDNSKPHSDSVARSNYQL